jgi:hypothetical protein
LILQDLQQNRDLNSNLKKGFDWIDWGLTGLGDVAQSYWSIPIRFWLLILAVRCRSEGWR